MGTSLRSMIGGRNAYGLDVKIVSPPHAGARLGNVGIARRVGAGASRQNRVQDVSSTKGAGSSFRRGVVSDGRVFLLEYIFRT